jgi:hypothetical protein
MKTLENAIAAPATMGCSGTCSIKRRVGVGVTWTPTDIDRVPWVGEPSPGAAGCPTGQVIRAARKGSRQTVQGGLAMGKKFVTAALLAALTLALAACGGSDDEESASATAAPTTTVAQAATGITVAVASSSLGDILVDAQGRTLYAFTKDKAASRPAAASAPTTGRPSPAPPPPGSASRPRCCPPLPRPTAALR